MNLLYLDTSALIKKYIQETGSGWLSELLLTEPQPSIYTSHLTVVEASCAFARRRREGTISQELHLKYLAILQYDSEHHYKLMDVTPEIIKTASELANRHPLRAYDAIHLATGLLLNENLKNMDKTHIQFISSDKRLLDMAQAEGLQVDDPNLHP